MSMPNYRRGEDSPPAGPRYRLIRLKASECCNVSILGTRFHPFWTHWGNRRTQPCTLPKENCEGCQLEQPQRWKAYLHVIREDRLEEGFLELTALGRDRIREIVGGDKYLRGSRLKVQRGRGDKTALQFLLLRNWSAENDGSPMPDEKSPDETLHALYSFRRAKPGGEEGEA